jgi:shikimate dehydrogenase
VQAYLSAVSADHVEAGEAGRGGQRRAAVLGSPIEHSLSPVLHRAAYAALGLAGWRYDRVECDEAALPELVGSLGPEWVGLSLTMPLKRKVLDLADEVSPLAAAVGAANTLLLGGARPGGRRAENTDVAGLLAALREAGLRRVDRSVLLGAGGTAQAALAALRELGDPSPRVLVRDPGRATGLLAAADRLGVRPVVCGGLPDTPLPEADVVISTLPGGAADAVADAVTVTVGAGQWAPGTIVLDAVYAPWPTRFAASAADAGCRVVGGLAVLLHQAVAQVELMTGQPAPVAAMRAALEAAAVETTATVPPATEPAR